ncbi:hypothetical protein BGZ83_009694 [Gryganskiella cystojenkinii]|nr:hypothetical protein BGZ83_009694 [Gryganskiella cystojenkinii]
MSTPKMALTNKQLRPTPYARPFVSAATLQTTGDFDLALQYLTRALTLAPSNINLLDSRAACFEKLNRVPDALLDAKAMIKAHPQEPKGYLRAGKLFRVQQNLKSATKIFVAGVERSTKGSQEYETLVRIANDMRARMDQLAKMTKMNRTSSIETFSLRLNHKVQSQEFSRLWSVTPKLRSLDLHGCSGVSDGVVQAVLARCPMLEELDISDCRVTEAFATSSFFSMETDIPPEPLPRMKKLVLGRWDVPISRQGVDTVVLRFPNLETLDLLAMRVLSITALESLSQLKQLKHLYTDSLETTSEEATFFVFQKWVEGIPNLESLQMSACKGLSDNCLHYMVAGSDNYANLAEATDRKGWSRSLRMLNFSLSPYLTNQGLVLLGTHSIPNLHTLILNKCGRLDENGMLSLVQGSGSGLTRLEFGGYRKCSDKLLFALRDHCPRISYLNLAHAGELSGIGLLSLVDARGRGLERICVDDCPYVGADAAERARTLLGDRSRVSYVFHRTYQS